jgi:uncharacterized protein (DUF1810 family)
MVPSIPSSDPYNLQRFVEAQQEDYEDVRAELHAGRKQTHWMWYIFPQIKGLGRLFATPSPRPQAQRVHPTREPH